MAQSNYNIPNESAPAVRAQLNSVFQSIASNNSGASAPATTFPHQWWYDTSTNILKQRNAADSAWIEIGTFDQTNGTFSPSGVTGASVISALGFTPVEQGGGVNMGNNKVRIGWSISDSRLLAQVDAFQAGTLHTSELPTGQIGTYAFLRLAFVAEIGPGSLHAGSILRYSGVNTDGAGNSQNTAGATPSGTWRCMGQTSGGGQWVNGQPTLFLRIS